MSAASAIFLMRKDISQMHQEMMDFIVAHPNMAHSDSSSEVTIIDTSVQHTSITMSVLQVSGALSRTTGRYIHTTSEP
jgi:hypothetical protein